jgi:hypothetical protein
LGFFVELVCHRYEILSGWQRLVAELGLLTFVATNDATHLVALNKRVLFCLKLLPLPLC